MRLNLNTKIHDLLNAHAFLLDFLVGWAPEFAKLKNPVARATIGRIATVQMAARLAHREPKDLLEAIRGAIEAQTGTAPVVGEPEPPSPEEAKARREALKAIVKELHDGKSPAELKARFDLLLNDAGPAEIGRMENELIAEGLPVGEVRRLCELHVDVFREGLGERPDLDLPAGHPIHTFMAENRMLERFATGLREEFALLGTPKAAERRAGLVAQLEQLAALEKHYVRKENLLFPLLEKAGVSGPPQVMWAVHDDIRALLKKARAAAEAGDEATLAEAGPEGLQAAVDMIFKEEAILFPLCLELLPDGVWAGIRAAEAEIGYAWVAPGNAWKPETSPSATGLEPRAPSRLPLDTGLLSIEQVNLMLNHLPVDLSFVDENDEVRYFNAGLPERLFPRSPQVIGRKVQNCHPPKSMGVVNEILASFRAGTRDQAEFWITIQGKFVHIRYFAVRDAKKQYRGCLEVTQDVTHIRALEGQRRLLDWN